MVCSFLPRGERNCYEGLAANWVALDGMIGGYSAHAANLTIHVTAADKEAWNGKADTSALTAHTGNTTIHVTAEDKSKWNAVTTKADDADAVHKSGEETIAGLKTFTDLMSIDGDYLGTEASTNQRTILQLRSNRDTAGKSGALITRFRQNRTQGGLLTGDLQMFGIDFLENEVRTGNILSIQATGWANSVPTKVSIVSAVSGYSYGNRERPCKINGLNPGALSLPDLTAGVDISAYITDLTGASNINKFTPTADGWISIGLSNADFIEIYIPSSLIGGSFTKSTVNNYGQAFMPVIANKEVRFALKGSSIGWAKFYPCQGNI